jgi:hypothetical protein
MLLDMLGILIGFMAVMLLLSLLVTALTEFLQSLLRLRPRNLTFGLTSLLEQALAPAANEPRAESAAESGAEPAPAAAPAPRPEQAAELARGIMRLHRFQPERQTGVAAAIAPAPPLSSIDLPAVLEGLARQGVTLTPQQAERLDRLFPEVRASMRARFERNVKRVAFALAVLVAFIMQVNALSLLARLADDAEFRARAVAAGERLADAAEGELLLSPRSYEEVSAAALAELQRQRPEEAEYLEQASGIGVSRADILAELDLILTEENHPNRSALLEDYARLLDAEHRRSIGQIGRPDRRREGRARRARHPPVARRLGVLPRVAEHSRRGDHGDPHLAGRPLLARPAPQDGEPAAGCPPRAAAPGNVRIRAPRRGRGAGTAAARVTRLPLSFHGPGRPAGVGYGEAARVAPNCHRRYI